MPLTLRKATPEDAKALVEVYLSAFQKDAVSLMCFPRTEASSEWWYDSVMDEIVESTSHFICVVDADSPSQTIVSWAKWNSPGAPEVTELPEWPAGCDVEVANHFFGNLFSRHAKIMDGRKHWYLEIVGTRPEYMGKGAAGQLLRWGIQKADEEELEAYLEASPEGKPIYEHFGFKEMDRLVVELKEEMFGEEKFIECMMVRPASKTKKSGGR